MTEFKRLSDTMLTAEQIAVADVARARDAGVTLIVNNRPDGEASDQPDGEAIRAAAQAAGLDYRAIPIGPAGFGMEQVEDMAAALAQAEGAQAEGAQAKRAQRHGKVLAFCRSGTRSTLLWALARARAGDDLAAIEAAAGEAGYDVGPVRAMMEGLAQGDG